MCVRHWQSDMQRQGESWWNHTDGQQLVHLSESCWSVYKSVIFWCAKSTHTLGDLPGCILLHQSGHVYACVGVFFFFNVCLFWNLCLPLCAYLTIYWVFCVFMMCLRVCINPSIHICTHAYSKNVFWCLCEPVCVAFEICRGGCLSLCTRQSFCHDSQTAKKKKREEWESKRRKGRMRTGGKRDSEAELELENCFRQTVCVCACVSVCAF